MYLGEADAAATELGDASPVSASKPTGVTQGMGLFNSD